MEKKLKVGQAVECGIIVGDGRARRTTHRRGTIAYIHPEHRYIVVFFDTPGGPVREAFKPEDVAPIQKGGAK